MRLRQTGELKLLREIRDKFGSSRQAGVIVGIGDDTAVIAPRKGNILVTTDMMNEGVHFDLSYTSPFSLGFKLVSVNVSDIMAMCGRPEYLFLDIAMKGDTDREFFGKLYEGISAAMDTYGVKLLGGDLCAARHDMVLSGTVMGVGERVITRSGANIGDKIYVTGTVGDSACGLEILKRLTPSSKKKVMSYEWGVKSKRTGNKGRQTLSLTHNSKLLTHNFEKVKPLLMRHLMPVARDSGGLASYATSMIDVSDGLFLDLSRICDESKVGARIYLDRVPISDEMRHAADVLGIDPVALATSGGEDYELLFTAAGNRDSAHFLRQKMGAVPISCIGEITKKKYRVVVDASGREREMKVKGYQHFGA